MKRYKWSLDVLNLLKHSSVNDFFVKTVSPSLCLMIVIEMMTMVISKGYDVMMMMMTMMMLMMLMLLMLMMLMVLMIKFEEKNAQFRDISFDV